MALGVEVEDRIVIEEIYYMDLMVIEEGIEEDGKDLVTGMDLSKETVAEVCQ